MDGLTLLDEVIHSPAVGLLRTMERDGFTLTPTKDGRLSVVPGARVTAEQFTWLTTHREHLLIILSAIDQDVQERRRVFSTQYVTSGPFIFRACPYVPGVCHSCGDDLPTLTWGSCWRCMLAKRLAVAAPLSLMLSWDEGRVVT